MDLTNSEAKGNILRKCVLAGLCFLSEPGSTGIHESEGRGKNRGLRDSRGPLGSISPSRAGAASLARPAQVCECPQQHWPAQSRPIQWLHSQARGPQNCQDKNMMERQEGRAVRLERREPSRVLGSIPRECWCYHSPGIMLNITTNHPRDARAPPRAAALGLSGH